MVVSQRERIIGFATVGVLALLALDRFAFTPLFERRTQLNADTQIATLETDRGRQLTQSASRMTARWNDMVTAGLKSEATEAESQAMRSLHDWAQDAGLKLTVLNPDRARPVERPKDSRQQTHAAPQPDGAKPAEKQQEFQQITLRASGSGSMRSVSRFLWRAQTAAIPLKVTDLQLSATKEGTDDLLMNVTVSTLTLAPVPAGQGAWGAPR